MSQVTFHGNQITINGEFPQVGSVAPAFKLVDEDLSDRALTDFTGKRKVLNIFPSIDTGVCATSVRRFNELVSKMDNTEVICVSADLPFAQGRFCGAEGIQNLTMLSTMRGQNFLKDYGVSIAEGPLTGLAARAVIVLDTDNKVLHSELVKDIGEEPNYNAVLKVLD